MLDSNKFDKTGLVGYWGLNGNTLESSGNNRNGVLSGNASYVAGKKGQGLLFNNVNGYSGSVIVTDNIFIMPTEFSAFCWIKKGLFVLYEDILGNRSAGQTLTWVFCTGTETSNKGISVYTGIGQALWNSQFIIPENEWCLVGFTVKGNILNLYANGDNCGSFSNFTYRNYSINSLTISGFVNGSEGFNGVIDEVSYWNRELSAEEVKKLYNNGKGIFI